MRKSKALKTLESTALREGVSVAEVRREIENAIDHAYEKQGRVNGRILAAMERQAVRGTIHHSRQHRNTNTAEFLRSNA
jgi:hypothetical protein